MKCEFGGRNEEAVYQTYFLGDIFLKLCKEHEEQIFPKGIPKKEGKPPHIPATIFEWGTDLIATWGYLGCYTIHEKF